MADNVWYERLMDQRKELRAYVAELRERAKYNYAKHETLQAVEKIAHEIEKRFSLLDPMESPPNASQIEAMVSYPDEE